MKRLIVGLFIAIAPGLCFAQNRDKKSGQSPKPNFSGAWVLDEAKSTSSSGKGNRITNYNLNIEHHEPEIRFSKKFKQDGREVTEEVVYYTDGRPEFSSRKGGRDSEPVTRWRGQKLVRRSVKESTGSFKMRFETLEEWVLSDDGQSLTRTVLNTGLGMTTKSKDVFNRLW